MDRRRLYTGGAMMVLAPLGLGGCESGNGGKDLILIAPADVAGEVPDGWRDVIAIAPWDPGPADVAPPDLPPPDLTPDDVAIAPWDPGPADVAPPDLPPPDLPPDVIAIAPFDAGPDLPPPPGPGGYLDTCRTDGECGQEYFCYQVMICIAPGPGCETACGPIPCGGDGKCPEGAACIAYDSRPEDSTLKTCVRGILAPPVPAGTWGGDCATDADCLSDQHFCQDACTLAGAMCIVPVEACLPRVCDVGRAVCPAGAECRDVGITTACVKK